MVYAKQWWREFLEIRPSNQSKMVKIFAQVCYYNLPKGGNESCENTLQNNFINFRFVTHVTFIMPMCCKENVTYSEPVEELLILQAVLLPKCVSLQDENGVNRPVCSYVHVLRASRLLESPRQAARFVSLLAHERAPVVGGGDKQEQWCTLMSFLCRGKVRITSTGQQDAYYL